MKLSDQRTPLVVKKCVIILCTATSPFVVGNETNLEFILLSSVGVKHSVIVSFTSANDMHYFFLFFLCRYKLYEKSIVKKYKYISTF